MPSTSHRRSLLAQMHDSATNTDPATVVCNPGTANAYCRVYAHYVPAAPVPATDYREHPIHQRAKHVHPAPTPNTPLCGQTGGAYGAFKLGACTRPAGHLLIEGSAHRSDGYGWFLNASEASRAATVILSLRTHR
jgi:hypothetical protein